jgi:ABC-2 type transport system ATP-binding protein
MAIVVDGVVVNYGSFTAIDGLSLRVEPGHVVALLGPNGAGKTTLLETIEGYRSPDRGSVRVFGLDPVADRHALAPRWGVMPQRGGFPMGLTVGEAVRLFAGLSNATDRVPQILDATGLTTIIGRRWRACSGGEQQRLSLAIALCGGSELLLLDEPTAAVDAEGRDRILELVRRRADAGAAVLLTTHRFDDVERVADRAVIIASGRARAAGTIDELTVAPDRIEFRSAEGLPVADLGRRLGAAVTELRPGAYVTDAVASTEVVTVINGWLAEHSTLAESMLVGRRTLEDVVLELTGTDR